VTEGEREVPEGAATERSAEDARPDTQGAAEAAADAAAGDADEPGAPEAEAEALDVTTPDDLFGPIEAIMMVVDEPLPAITLAQVLNRPVPEVEEALQKLSESYTAEGRGFDLRQVGGGWRFYTREQYAEIVERFVLDGQQAKLTQAALETLAVVAYQQPVSRARVSAVRGVNCDGVMRTLLTRGLIEEAGTDRESGATLYRTTSYFLERLGLRSLDELPSLAPYLPEVDEVEQEETVAPAAAHASAPESGGPDEAAAAAGAVSPDGEPVSLGEALSSDGQSAVRVAEDADSPVTAASWERPA
jgi:segregation and condensation protein B